MADTYFYEEIPMNRILATEKEIEKRLFSEECKLATKCSPCPAYITLKLNNGTEVLVARARKWDSKRRLDTFMVQILDVDCNVLFTTQYDKGSDSGLMMVAVKLIRMAR